MRLESGARGSNQVSMLLKELSYLGQHLLPPRALTSSRLKLEVELGFEFTHSFRGVGIPVLS